MLNLAFTYESVRIGKSQLIHADCFEWLGRVPENTFHAIVTDPPYGVKEYDFDQLEKRANGNGGSWRIPPSFDGHVRAPLPRFTALDGRERERLRRFFIEWGRHGEDFANRGAGASAKTGLTLRGSAMEVDESQTANAYGCRWAFLVGEECISWSIKAKADRHTRVGGPCGGGVVGRHGAGRFTPHETTRPSSP
jgi:hypothetical protein